MTYLRRCNRYELKYLVTTQQAERIIKDLENMVSADEHGGRDGYRVVSLYYDSPNLDFFWAKIEGLKFRRKLRLRIYPESALSSVTEAMVEIKQRMNRTVQKKRLKLPLEEAEELCAGSLVRQELDGMDRQVASEVLYLVQAIHLQPTCITDYWRVAFVGGNYNPGLRITFDTRLTARSHALKINLDAPGHRILPPDWCIMEVKVNEAVPDWVTSLLARHNCQLRRLSKYCAGLALTRGINVLPLTLSPIPSTQEANHE